MSEQSADVERIEPESDRPLSNTYLQDRSDDNLIWFTLNGLKNETLRMQLSAWSKSTLGPKRTLVARLFITAKAKMSTANCDFKTVLEGTKFEKDVKDYLKKIEMTSYPPAPCMEEIYGILKSNQEKHRISCRISRRKNKNDNNLHETEHHRLHDEEQNAAELGKNQEGVEILDFVAMNPDMEKDFNVQEVEGNTENLSIFARLVVLIRDDSEIRTFFTNTRKDMRRSDLDANLTGEEFWDHKISPKLNNTTFQPSDDYIHVISEINMKKAPTERKSGDQLRTMIIGIRTDFAIYYNLYNRSSGQGENDVYRFRTILLDKCRNNGKALNRKGELNALGKKCIILFVALRQGTAEKNKYLDLVRFFSKTQICVNDDGTVQSVGEEGGIEDYDNINEEEYDGDSVKRKESRSVSRKRKGSGGLDDMISMMESNETLRMKRYKRKEEENEKLRMLECKIMKQKEIDRRRNNRINIMTELEKVNKLIRDEKAGEPVDEKVMRVLTIRRNRIINEMVEAEKESETPAIPE